MDAEGCKLSTYLSPEHFGYFQVLNFLQVKSDARTLREALDVQLQLDGCKNEVMIAANAGTWKRPYVCFVGAGLEPWGVRMYSIWL